MNQEQNKNQDQTEKKVKVVIGIVVAVFAIWTLIEGLYWMFQIINC